VWWQYNNNGKAQQEMLPAVKHRGSLHSINDDLHVLNFVFLG
jgi:hypothetical protein